MKYHTLAMIAAAGGLAVCLFMTAAGCKPGGTSPNPNATDVGQAEHDDHDHGHSHGHEETGPHGGHLVEIGDEQLHAEWTHNDDNGEVVVYLLDSAAESDAAIPAGDIVITTKIGDAEKSYELTAVSPVDGQASKFSMTDPSLVEALKAVGPGVEATIAVAWNDEQLIGTFERHDHAGHQH